jgi:polysaccharide chain length determinant protein (PEP-CTERM system associated)
MVSNGEMSLADVKRILKRYWWIPATTTVLLGAIGLLATYVLPKKYTSSTIVLVEQPTVPMDIVKPIVSDDLNHRLASMQQQILSRSRLQPIIEKFNLYPNMRQKHMDELVEELKKSIEVELIQPMQGSINRQPPGFHVSVTFDNPQTAQQICSEITSMFMEQNAKRREKQSEDTTQFLSGQLEEAKAKLDEQDAKLAEFKRRNLGELPEEQQTNLTLMAGMNSQLEATTQALSRAQQDKVSTETMLNLQEANWKATQSGAQNPETEEKQMEELQDQLSSLLARYTPEHPDVIKLKAQIEDLRRKLDEDPSAKKHSSNSQVNLHEPPQLQQLRVKVKSDEMSIVDLTKRQAQIQDQIRILQGRVQASPMVEQQFKELTRNYQSASEFYNNLLKNRDNAGMATALEQQQESETFKVLDAPSLPSSPSFPKKIVFVGGGLGGGFALALGILYLLAISDKAMYTERDVESCLQIPVLTSVPGFDVSMTGIPDPALR